MEFNPISENIVDYLLNVRRIYSRDELVPHISKLTGVDTEEVWSEWDWLSNEGIIAYRDSEYVIKKKCLSEVENKLRESLSAAGITADMIGSQLDHELSEHPERLSKYVRLIGSLIELYEGSWGIIFSDYEWSRDPGPTCDEFALMRIMFLGTTSSKKHSYRRYYFRRWPFDSREMLHNLMLKHLRIEGLSDIEWRLLSHLLLSRDMTLSYAVLSSIQDITEAELRESINKLKEKGHLTEQYDRISLNKGVYSPLMEYFCANVYPRFKAGTVFEIKNRIMKGFSNLYPFMCAGRLNELPGGNTQMEPIRLKTIHKSDIKEDTLLTDMARLGLVMDLGDNIVILGDVIRDIEDWIKGSLQVSLKFIPARDAFLARSILMEMFSSCESCVKIQDPYLGEDTLMIISQYVSKELDIKVLTGQIAGRDDDIADICRYIERLRNERKGRFQIMFLGDTEGNAPFHDRYVISQNRCWSIGTSLKQIGRGKDTTIVEIPLTEKDEKIEPAFDWNWSAKKTELEKKNLTRLDFEEWKVSISPW